MKFKIMLVATIVTLLFQGIAFSAIYRWVDKDGVISFHDTPPGKNPEQAKLVSSAPNATAASTPAAVDKAVQAAPQVELYVTSWCPYCKQAEAFFRTQGIPFKSYDVEKDPAAERRKNELDNRRGVPFAIINGQKIHGFSEGAYQEALSNKP